MHLLHIGTFRAGAPPTLPSKCVCASGKTHLLGTGAFRRIYFRAPAPLGYPRGRIWKQTPNPAISPARGANFAENHPKSPGIGPGVWTGGPAGRIARPDARSPGRAPAAFPAIPPVNSPVGSWGHEIRPLRMRKFGKFGPPRASIVAFPGILGGGLYSYSSRSRGRRGGRRFLPRAGQTSGQLLGPLP